MTTTQANPLPQSRPSGPADVVRARASRARLGIVAVLVAAVVAAGLARDWASRTRAAATVIPGTTAGASRSSLGSMNSFSLALLLGGLRGPLVMFLWSTSESQKADKNLEDFDTKVEWIRLLQPEFDTVHIFQIWNKAYNISVQMASLSNKYATILDALEYARNVNRGRPDNINVITSMAQVFGDKLGNSQEKNWYRARVRAESLPHVRRQRLARTDPAWRAIELDPMLDASGNILPELLAPTRTRPTSPDASGGETAPFNDGSELQYLKPYAPFPYGLSPLAIAYNYYRQAQVLQLVAKQKHAQLSDLVMDSRPALTLKQWAEDEMQRGRRNERLAYGGVVPYETLEMEVSTIAPPPGRAADPARIDEAINAYDVAARVAVDSIAAYEDHLTRFLNNQDTYASHIDGLVALRHMALGDAAFLRALRATGPEQAAAYAVAAENYRLTANQNYRILLRYYTDDQQAAQFFPDGLTRLRVDDIPADRLATVYAAIRASVARQPFDSYAEDRTEYEAYIARAEGRIRLATK